MIDGPTSTLLIEVLAASTGLFGGATVIFANSHAKALKLLDAANGRADLWKQRAHKENLAFKSADTARQTAIATHEAYLAAEPERQAAHLKAYFSRIAVKGNQSPKRRKAEG